MSQSQALTFHLRFGDRRLIPELKQFISQVLAPKAVSHLLLEIGNDQTVVVSGLLKQAGFIDIEVKKDLSGHDRLIICRKKSNDEE